MHINISEAFEVRTEPKLWAKLYLQAAEEFVRTVSFYPCCRGEPLQKVAILSHQNPDGDAIGATLGLGHMINDNADVVMINPGPMPKWFDFLPGVKMIKRPDELSPDYVPDCAIALDTSDKERLGAGKSIFDKAARKIWIDHHSYPDRDLPIADLCVIDSHAGACGEMLTHIFYYLSRVYPPRNSVVKTSLTRDAATALAVALHADTGGLRWLGTNYYTSLALSTLQRAEVNWTDVTRIGSMREWEDMKAEHKFIGYFMNDKKMRLDQDGKLAWCVLTQKEIAKFNIHNQVSPLTASLLYNIEQVKGLWAAAVFIENPDNTARVRIHSNCDWLAVNGFSKFFSGKFCIGGGHELAAGYTIFHGANGLSLNSGIRRFLNVLKEHGNFR